MNRKLSWGIITGALILALCLTTAGRADDGWTLKFDSDAIMCKIVDSARGITSTTTALSGIDLKTGTLAWTIGDWHCNSPQHIGIIPNTPLAVILKVIRTEKRNSMSGAIDVTIHNEIGVVDIDKGIKIWSKDTLDIYSCVGYTLLPRGDALLLCARDSANDFRMLTVEAQTGNVIWENREFFGGHDPETFYSPGSDRMIDGNQAPVFDTDSTMITIYRKNELRKWNVLTGKMIWQSDLDTDGTPSIADGYTPIMLSPDRTEAWVPCGKGLQTISVIDGSVKWPLKVDLPGLAKQIIPMEQTLLIIGGPNADNKGGRPYITMIDRATGERTWEKDFKKFRGPKVSPGLLSDDSVYIYFGNKMYAVALADGSYAEIAKDLKFEGGEYPESFTRRGGNYLLLSAQNMMMLDPSFNIVYRTYNKAPGTAFFLKALAFTAQVALNTVSAMYFSVPLYSGGGYTWFVYPALNFGLPKYGNSTSGEHHMFVLTKVEENSGDKPREGWGIAKINKSTGHIDNQVIIGEKNPEYDIAPTGDAIMYIGDDDGIVYRSI